MKGKTRDVVECFLHFLAFGMFADLCLPFLLLLAGLVFSRLLCRNFTFHLRVICAVIDSLFCISCNQKTSFLILVLKVII